jgi:hypothetical protein
MQPHVKHIDVYVRTAVWFISIAGNDGNGTEYTDEERTLFRKDLRSLVEHAKYLEGQMNSLWSMFFKDTETQKEAVKMFTDRMAEFIKDERLLKGFTPKFDIGCRRITPGMDNIHNGPGTANKNRRSIHESYSRTQRRRTLHSSQ